MSATPEFKERIGRIEALIQKLESADPVFQRTARQLMESLMELHGAGIERILGIVSNAQEGADLVQSLANDELIGSLLVLYNLHPEDFETRVKRGVEKLRPLLRSYGARLDRIAIVGGVVRVKVVGAGASELQAAVRNALFETAPDAADIVIEGGTAAENASGFVPLSSLRTLNGAEIAATEVGRS